MLRSIHYRSVKIDVRGLVRPFGARLTERIDSRLPPPGRRRLAQTADSRAARHQFGLQVFPSAQITGPGPVFANKRVQTEFFDSIIHLPECEAKVVCGLSSDPPVALQGRRNFLALDLIQP